MIEELRDADPLAAQDFFARVDPVDLVREIRRTSDVDLLELLTPVPVRAAATAGILARLDEFADHSRLVGLEGTVRFEITRAGALLEQRAIALRDGAIRVVPADAPPDVVVRTSLLRFVRIVTGTANAGLEYLGGTLDLDGDALLALGVGGAFVVPGEDAVAVDPSALDAHDVATVLTGVPTQHLRKVMNGPFRRIVLDEIYRRLPEFVSDRAAGVRLTVGFRLVPELAPGVQPTERFAVRLADGRAEVLHDVPAAERDATVTCESHDFLRLATGHLNPLTGVLRGTLRVRGDRVRALQLVSAIDIPQPSSRAGVPRRHTGGGVGGSA